MIKFLCLIAGLGAFLGLSAGDESCSDCFDDELRDLIYRAEVYGQVHPALSQLGALLAQADGADQKRLDRRHAIVKAMAVIYGGMVEDAKAPSRFLPEDLAQPQALLLGHNQVFVLVAGEWVATGQWAGDFYLEAWDRTRDGLVFRNLEGQTLHKSLLGLPPALSDSTQIRSNDAGVLDILRHLATLQNLSLYAPAGLDRPFYGSIAFQNWLDLTNLLCRRLGFDWIKRRESIVLRQQSEISPEHFWRIESYEGEDILLREFLDMVASGLGVTAVLDERLTSMKVDIFLQDESWQEAMTCLAMTYDLVWQLSMDSETPTLVVQIENE